MCVYLYIQNNYTHYTHIYYVNTNFNLGYDELRLIIAQSLYIYI